MDKKPEDTMDGCFFIFILRYILNILLEPRNYIVETHLKLYSVKEMFFLITYYWSDLMSCMFVKSVSSTYIHPWPNGVKGKNILNLKF